MATLTGQTGAAQAAATPDPTLIPSTAAEQLGEAGESAAVAEQPDTPDAAPDGLPSTPPPQPAEPDAGPVPLGDTQQPPAAPPPSSHPTCPTALSTSAPPRPSQAAQHQEAVTQDPATRTVVAGRGAGMPAMMETGTPGPAPGPGPVPAAELAHDPAAAAAVVTAALAAVGAGSPGRSAAMGPSPSSWDAARLSDPQLCSVLRAVWGHADFRGSQLPLIRAVLEGRSIVGILPTGAGKSLCYQLPALLMPGLTLVVSPLLALMRDQLDRLPPGVPGAMLWGGQTRSEAEVILKEAASGALKLLYIAPEKLLNPGILSALRSLPSGRIPCVCVDEAHCVSEWGHSFRPAYFRLGHVLRAVLRPRCVLALTATATKPTQTAITQVLGLDPESFIRESPLRDNLRLQVIHVNGATGSGRSVSWLASALKAGQLHDIESVIVYVAFQAQADEVADSLKRSGVRAVAYHAGKGMDERQKVQAAFCAGGARVVVATVAFGMGVDKAKLGAVVHLQMPRSLEDYVQQAGRAGRDGSEAQCVMLLDKTDYVKLRSLGHSTAADRAAIATLLVRIFQPLQDYLASPTGQAAAAAEAAGSLAFGAPPAFGVLTVKEVGLELDLTEEVMETVMSYLQGHSGQGLITALPSTSAFLDIFFHRTPPQHLAKRHPIIAALLASKPKVIKGIHKANMARLVAAAGVSSSAVVGQLAELARLQEIHFEMSPMRALAWRVVVRHQPDLDALTDSIFQRLCRQQQVAIRRLDVVYSLMAAAGAAGDQRVQEALIRRAVTDYFDSEADLPHMPRVRDLPEVPRDSFDQLYGPFPDDEEDNEPCGFSSRLGDALRKLVGGGSGMDRDGDMLMGGAGSDAGRPDAGAGNSRNNDDEERSLQELPVAMAPDRAAPQVAAFLRTHRQRVLELARDGRRLTGVAVARIFHGLATPAYPSDQWRKCGFWGQYTAWDFGYIAEVAGREIERLFALQGLQPSG
ncbi:P-loop containing nucleoside triphosphate hydrolase protein [Haematococcus lacustris]